MRNTRSLGVCARARARFACSLPPLPLLLSVRCSVNDNVRPGTALFRHRSPERTLENAHAAEENPLTASSVSRPRFKRAVADCRGTS